MVGVHTTLCICTVQTDGPVLEWSPKIGMVQQEIFFGAVAAKVIKYRTTCIGIMGAIKQVYGEARAWR
jgi:hypothetical protein